MHEAPIIFLNQPAAPGHGARAPIAGQPAANTICARHAETMTDGNRTLLCIGRGHLADGRPRSEGGATDWLATLLGADWRGDMAAVLARHARNHFALVGIDRAEGRMFAATDRFSTRPVYWCWGPGGLTVSNSLKMVAEHTGASTLDPEALFDYLYFHNIPAPRTIYAGIAKLAPASVLESRWSVSGGGPTMSPHVSCWWRPGPTIPVSTSGAPTSEGLLAALAEGIETETPGSATGCFLSGGLDSSTVTELLGRRGSHVDAFSIGFAGAEAYDELPFARISAAHAGAQLNEKRLTPADLARAIDTIATAYAEPFGNSSAVPTLYCAELAREAGFSQLFAGDGGDELFAGNARYAEQLKIARLCNYRTPLKLARMLLPDLPGLPLREKTGRLLALAALDIPDRLERFNFVHRLGAAALLSPDFLAAVNVDAPIKAIRARFSESPVPQDALQAMLYLDWKFTLADSDLPKVTRMCEVAGIDVRYPLLTDPVVDFSLTVPGRMMIQKGELRAFYRRAMRGFLAEATLAKSKHGFGLPFGVWLGADPKLGQRLDDSLGSLGTRNLFQPSLLADVGRLTRDAHAGYYGELAWLLMTLEEWLRVHQPDYRL